MQKHKDSHMDHGFTQAQWTYLFVKYTGKTAFFIDTFELPEELGMVTNELYGPSAGDPPVLESEVVYTKRGDREWNTRFVKKPKRPTRFVRVIAGPHEEPCPRCDGKGFLPASPFSWYAHGPSEVLCLECNGHKTLKHECILYTAYGVPSLDAPQSPKEPGDIRKQMEALEQERRSYFQAFQNGTATAEMKAREEAAHTKIIALRPKRDEANAFWAVHALAAPLSMMPCPTCGAPGMGDAVYDPPEPDTDERCQTCGYL